MAPIPNPPFSIVTHYTSFRGLKQNQGSGGVSAGQKWRGRLLGSLSSQTRMYDSCLSLKGSLPFASQIITGCAPSIPQLELSRQLTSREGLALNVSQQRAIRAAIALLSGAISEVMEGWRCFMDHQGQGRQRQSWRV